MKQPLEKLSLITSLWPFAKWGVDIVGPMPPGKGGRKFLLVAVDYFTKWAEAEALATITTANVVKFLWNSVICRFGWEEFQPSWVLGPTRESGPSHTPYQGPTIQKLTHRKPSLAIRARSDSTEPARVHHDSIIRRHPKTTRDLRM
jgi:hypothetical protein